MVANSTRAGTASPSGASTCTRNSWPWGRSTAASTSTDMGCFALATVRDRTRPDICQSSSVGRTPQEPVGQEQRKEDWEAEGAPSWGAHTRGVKRVVRACVHRAGAEGLHAMDAKKRRGAQICNFAINL